MDGSISRRRREKSVFSFSSPIIIQQPMVTNRGRSEKRSKRDRLINTPELICRLKQIKAKEKEHK